MSKKKLVIIGLLSISTVSLIASLKSDSINLDWEQDKSSSINEVAPNINKSSSLFEERSFNGSIVNPLNSSFYIELGMGVSSLSVNDNITKNFLRQGAVDTSSAVTDISLGHYFNENIFTSINYQTFKYDLSNISNTNFSINYQNTDLELNPYVGLVAGYSYLTWDENPIANFTTKIPSSESFTYGVQVGAEWKIDKSFSLTGKLQHLRFNHETMIQGENLKMNYQNIATIGVKFNF